MKTEIILAKNIPGQICPGAYRRNPQQGRAVASFLKDVSLVSFDVHCCKEPTGPLEGMDVVDQPHFCLAGSHRVADFS